MFGSTHLLWMITYVKKYLISYKRTVSDLPIQVTKLPYFTLSFFKCQWIFVVASTFYCHCKAETILYTNHMWNVSMYSIFAKAKSFYMLSFRCHCIIKIPEHTPAIFQTSCSWRSIGLLVLHYTSQTNVLRNPRQYLVEQNQCNAKQVLARPAFSVWRQHNFRVMEQWSTRRCMTTRHLTSVAWLCYWVTVYY